MITKISVTVTGNDERADRVGRNLFDMLKQQHGTLPFILDVERRGAHGEDLGGARYTNEGKQG